MQQAELLTLAESFLGAWNSQEVDLVLACYTEDVIYTDPNTRGSVHGHDAMRRYLTKLFAHWRMTWALREGHPLSRENGGAVLWHATFQHASGGPVTEADGMDLVLVRGDHISRNEVCFDRSALPRPEPADRLETLKQFLLRGWMTHDGMWFAQAYEQCGIEVANRLNRAAIRAMAPFEMSRLQKLLGVSEVGSFDELRAFMTGAMSHLAGDYMDFRWDWRPPASLEVRVRDCFAHKGITRIGAIDGYECGIFDRIYAWFEALGVEYRVSPRVEHCSMHTDGECVREFRFSF